MLRRFEPTTTEETHLATIGQILMPTKGEESYARIAARANRWLRAQEDSGRRLRVTAMSGEQVRRLFEDLIVQPKQIYLEALASAQAINVNDLLDAAGYETFASADPVAACLEGLRKTRPELTEADAELLSDFVREMIAKYEPPPSEPDGG